MSPLSSWARALGLGVVLLGALAGLARAQTPEGTVITNTSTVSYTDANGNSYTPVSASVNVTVGFVAGLDMTGATAATPASPSSADTLRLVYHNIGNGNDSLRVTETISVGGVITVTGYRINTTTYGTLAAFNSALSGLLVAQGDSLVIKVVYDVASGKGGVATLYTLNGFSRRNASVTDAQGATITPGQTAGVAVTPDNAQNLQKLPSNGTNYTQTFAVQNTGNGPDGFTLTASHPGTALSIVSVNGTAGSSATISGVAGGASQNVDVIYTVLSVAAGIKDTLVLTATSVANTSNSDRGSADLTVVKPAMAIAKLAYRDDQSTAVGAATVVPGEFLQYKVTVTNNGAAAASTVQVTNAIPAELTYVSATGDAAGWTIGFASGTVTAGLAGTLAAAASRFIWIRVQVK